MNLWSGFVIAIVALILLDLAIFHKKGHHMSLKTSILESLFWISLALGFNVFLYFHLGEKLAIEFLTGYVVEKSLSVDNLFVILLVFNTFKIPAEYQPRVLFWGVFGAIVFRAIMIVIGMKLVQEFNWLLYIFGGILVWSGVKFIIDRDEEDADLSHHWSMRLLKTFMPVSSEFDGEKFLTKIKGVWHATPLMVALVMVEASDIIFAVDSIPAVFSVTQDGFIAFSSNIMAILGLRALYFVISDLVSRMKYLKPGLSVILIFVGGKMLVHKWFHIESWISLLVILAVLAVAALTSWFVKPAELK
jgi:tellurite resistance protein TerC